MFPVISEAALTEKNEENTRLRLPNNFGHVEDHRIMPNCVHHNSVVFQLTGLNY